MAIVNNPKINGVYYVHDNHLKIADCSPKKGHTVIITSINKSKRTARVKTITSIINKKHPNKFNDNKLLDVSNGNLLVIPIRELRSKHLSAVNHNTRTIKLNQLHYKSSSNNIRFPKRYAKLIHRK